MKTKNVPSNNDFGKLHNQKKTNLCIFYLLHALRISLNFNRVCFHEKQNIFKLTVCQVLC